MRAIVAIALFISATCAAPQPPQVATVALQPVFARLEGLMPKFLKEASPDARKQFWDIISDKDATIEQTQSKLEEWAAKQGGDVQKAFKSAGVKIKEMISALGDAIEKSSLSATAKDAFKRLGEIAADGNQTFAQQLQKMCEFMKTVAADTRKEMRAFIGYLIKSAIENVQKN